MSKPIYLDYAATCPCDPRVVRAMDRAWGAANTSSSHSRGVASKETAIECRKAVAAAIGANAHEICWTSGATEADNLAIKGYAESVDRPHVFAPSTEHKAVLRSMGVVSGWGAVTYEIPVDSRGQLDLELIESILDEGNLLSCMLVNNETGVVHPIAEIARLCREAGAILHCDATQALGRLPIDVDALGVDLASFSAHKLCGPKGIGCLYVREGLQLAPQICGGAQERGLRAGTTPVPLCVGFATAAQIAVAMLEGEHARMAKMRSRLLDELEQRGVMFAVNGAGAPVVPSIISLSFPDTDADKLLALVGKDLCVSTGSACNEGERSHVMTAMGVPEDVAVLRVTLGRWTKPGDVTKAAESLECGVRGARV